MDNSVNIELWNKCLGIIRDIIPAEQFNTWFRDVTCISFEDKRLTLGVPSSFYAEQLDERYISVLGPTLKKVFGPDVQLFYRYNRVGSQPDSAVTEQSTNPSSEILGKQKCPPANPFQPVKPVEFDPQLNPRYTFENYCGGESNKIVRSIAEAIANDPDNRTFNPLFIYGDVGVGKTHLIQAIGIRIKEKNPHARVLYVTSRLFEHQYTASSKGYINSFYAFYQSLDVLIIDDIQEIHDKPGTQNTFYNIFNHLHQNGKQIIMACDRAPVDMTGFEERLLSRFRWGMQAELSRPDIELRRRVLSKKASQDGIDLPADVREYIARNVTSSIRDLEGVMVSLIAHAMVLDCPITLELAAGVVGRSVKTLDKRAVNFEQIAQRVSEHFNLSTDVILSKSRKREISDARQVLMYLARKVANMQLVDIGRMLQRTHATVNYACEAISDRLATDRKLADDIRAIESALV